MKKFKDIKYSEDFQIESGKSDYEFRMKKPSYWWLWALGIIAFMLLCCVRCEHSIGVKTVDIDSGENIVCDSVTINYTSHYLYKDGRFFVNETHSITRASDADGIIHFSDMPCSVFSYVFYAFSSAEYIVESECSVLPESPATGLFHYKWFQALKLAPKTTDVVLTVIDRETEEPLADALLRYSYNRGGKMVYDSIKSDAAGRCNMTYIPTCGSINFSRVSCYAYKDTSNISISVIEALSDDDIATIPLTPLKESFTFFVHNKYTHQPIPDAKVEIVLKNKNNVVRHGPISINVDGTGRGAYNDAFIDATLELKASKTNYKDSIYTPICTVKEFIDKSDSLRVIYLDPLPYNQTFVNVDSISRKPIVGVRNHIVVKSIDGNEYKYDETSNRQGVFTFKAIEGDHIVIDSKLDPKYEPKHTDIPKFEMGDTILLKPRVADLTFRTIIAGTQTLLPDCSLWIYDSEDNNYKPDNSDNGEFILHNVPLNANIFIIATKDGYEDNEYSVRNKNVKYLSAANQSERDIPMTVMLPPCNGGTQSETGLKAGHVSAPVSYNMGIDHGKFEFSYNTGSSQKDKIDIYNHEMGETFDGSPIWTSGMVATDGTRNVNIPFNKGSVITIIVTTGDDGSVWDYKVNCPK